MFVSFIRQNQQCARSISSILRCNFSTAGKLKREFPKCVYVQPPSQWLMVKINFQRLKSWDANFNEKEFLTGAKKATIVILDIIRLRDTTLLSKVATIKGFYQIYRELLNFPKSPKNNLLHFDIEDIHYINPVEVHIKEDGDKCKCDVDLFFMCMRYLDDIIKASKRNDLIIHRDIRSVESSLKKDKKKLSAPSEKVLFIEGYLRLSTIYSKQKSVPIDWRVSLFHFANFNIVPIK